MFGSRATFGMSGLLAVVPTHPVMLVMPKGEEAEHTCVEQKCFQKDVIVNNILQFCRPWSVGFRSSGQENWQHV
jgi:hypothetical protein